MKYRVLSTFLSLPLRRLFPLWNAKRDKSVENEKVSCIIENIGFAIKYVLYCVTYG